MERVADYEFSARVEAVISSTSEDLQGDQMPGFVLEEFREMYEKNPEQRIVTRGHNDEDQIGEIIDIWTEETDNKKLLKAEIGIFEHRKDAVQEFEQGDIGGFSIGFYTHPQKNRDLWEENSSDVNISVAGQLRDEFISDLLEEDKIAPKLVDEEIRYRIYIEKSAVSLATFEFILENDELIIEFLKFTVVWYLTKRSEGIEISFPDFQIAKGNIEINIDIGPIIKKTAQTYEDSGELSEKGIREIVEEEIEDQQDEYNEEK